METRYTCVSRVIGKIKKISLYIYHFSTVVDFSSKKYNGSTGHRNSWYQQRNLQWGCRWWDSNSQPLGYKPSALAIELTSSKAIAGKELSLSSWCIASLYIYHFSTVVDFSSEKYSGSTGHRNSWYQQRNLQWGCRWWDSNSQPLGYKPSALAIELTSSKAIAGKELSLSSWCIASLYIYHFSTVVDFSSEKYSGSTGHTNSWYQQRNLQWGCRWWDSNSQPLGYKPSALAIELTSSKAIAGKELSLSSWCIASLYIYHFSTVVDFSSEKYSGSTGHRNSWYQQRNLQWGCRWWDSNSQPLGYKPSALAIELTSSKAIAGKELSLSSWCIASLYIYHFSTVVDFSSEKYSGSTGHRNSWYQQRNLQWGCRWWDSNSQPLGYKLSALAIELTSSKAIAGKELSLSSWFIASLYIYNGL